MIDKKEEQYFQKCIVDNIALLASSFGLHGIMRSNLKYELILDIIGTVQDVSLNKVIEDFFNVLGKFYLLDTPVAWRSRDELSKIIVEEREYVKQQLSEGNYGRDKNKGKRKQILSRNFSS